MKINTRSQAINEKCRDCICDTLDKGTWREQVEACPDTACPLYSFRPLSQITRDKLKQEKISKMTPEQLERYKKKSDSMRERMSKLHED